jgi:hypothetical protein
MVSFYYINATIPMNKPADEFEKTLGEILTPEDPLVKPIPLVSRPFVPIIDTSVHTAKPKLFVIIRILAGILTIALLAGFGWLSAFRN